MIVVIDNILLPNDREIDTRIDKASLASHAPIVRMVIHKNKSDNTKWLIM